MEEQTKITIIEGNGYREIRVEGHNDDPIVCAGLSAIIETTTYGLQALANANKSVTIIREEK